LTDLDDLQRHLPMAPHAFHILLSLLDEDRHGYALLKDIDERTGGGPALGTSTLYASIRRLMRDGFLTEAEPPEGEETEGPPRKYFRITEKGRALARAEARRVQRLHTMVSEPGVQRALGVSGGGKGR